MANAEYHHGEMEIEAHKGMWHGFVKSATFGSVLTLILVGFLTLTFAIGMNWLISLALMVIAGLAIGFIMGMGATWIATLILVSAIAAFARFVIWIFGLVL